jgi:hypothetical protein
MVVSRVALDRGWSHEAADRRRLIGAVDAIDRVAEVEGARAERIAFATGCAFRGIVSTDFTAS